METKTLQTLLKEKDYKVRGEQEKKKLSLACAEFIEQDNKAIWYYDLAGDIEKYVKELYDKKEIAKYSYDRKVWNSEMKHYREDLGLVDKTDEEITQIILKKNAEDYCKRSSFTLLESLMKSNKEFFNIKNFYGILRENYHLNQEDKLELSLPTYLFTKENFDKYLNEGLKFENKRYPKQRKNKFEHFIEEKNEIDNFDIENNFLFHGDKTYQEFFAREYLWTLSNLPIAYKDPKKAIEFFEKETGVNLSKPKEYKKLIF